jgi:hypothetical protein
MYDSNDLLLLYTNFTKKIKVPTKYRRYFRFLVIEADKLQKKTF